MTSFSEVLSKKICRVVERELPDADFRKYLVLDATTGQNAVAQAEVFGEAVDLDGIILTKLDGTAKGGVVVAISDELELPVLYVGVGEKIDDLTRQRTTRTAETVWAMVVASATPATSMFSTMTKNRFKITFSTPDSVR